ncbi:MAG: hypothetical protein JSW68_05425 [Burkholderiales bacterium]|nr:MAG: hypothetical protein JSW68_05425 [Burkholderiales bacterium]
MLGEITSRRHGEQPRVRDVPLAVDLARHGRDGSDDPALPAGTDMVCPVDLAQRRRPAAGAAS